MSELNPTKDYQNDKYENFFRNLKASREGLARFGGFTAVAAAGVEALIAGHGPGLKAAVAALRADMVLRQGQAGSSQSGTSAEQTAFEALVKFVQATDNGALAGYLYDHADERDTHYPDKLSGLTQATQARHLTRFTAYVEAPEAAAAAGVKAAAAPARALLKKCEKAASARTQTRTSLLETAKELVSTAEALAAALWDVDTAAPLRPPPRPRAGPLLLRLRQSARAGVRQKARCCPHRPRWGRQ